MHHRVTAARLSVTYETRFNEAGRVHRSDMTFIKTWFRLHF